MQHTWHCAIQGHSRSPIYGQLLVKFLLAIGMLHFNALAGGDPLRISR